MRIFTSNIIIYCKLYKNSGTRRIIKRYRTTVISAMKEQSWSNVRPYSEIPGPTAIPFLGNTWRFVPYIGDFNIQEVDKVSKRLNKEYGNIVKVEGLLGRPDMVFLYDANEIERIFRQEEKMPLRPSMPSLDYYKHVMRKKIFGGQNGAGVIAVHGESWYNFRSKVQQVMLQPRTASMYIGAIEEASLAFIRRINKIKDATNEVPENFLNEINKWSLESIARVALDTRLGCMDDKADIETQKLIDAVHTFFTNVGILELKIPFWKLFPTPTWVRYVEALDTILNFTSKYTKISLTRIKSRSNNEHRELSLLERILKLDGNENEKTATILALDLFLVGIDTMVNKFLHSEKYMSTEKTATILALDLFLVGIDTMVNKFLHSEKYMSTEKTATILALDLFLVGIDTTANAVASVLYQLACNPSKQAILHDEIDRELPVHDMKIERVHVDKLRYVKACIKETLRMRPVVIGNGRCTTKNTAIGGFEVPKGVQVIFQHYVISNQEKYFPRCDEFLPERWLGESNSRHAFASLPFGYGRRMCLGRRFADLEMIIVISKIVKKFRLEYCYEKLDYHINPLYTPKGPLKLKFIER